MEIQPSAFHAMPTPEEARKVKNKELKCLTKLQTIVKEAGKAGAFNEVTLQECEMSVAKLPDNRFKDIFTGFVNNVRAPQRKNNVQAQIKKEITAVKRDLRALEKQLPAKPKKRERQEVEKQPAALPPPAQVESTTRRFVKAVRQSKTLQFGMAAIPTIGSYIVANWGNLTDASKPAAYLAGRAVSVVGEGAGVAFAAFMIGQGIQYGLSTPEPDNKKNRPEAEEPQRK